MLSSTQPHVSLSRSVAWFHAWFHVVCSMRGVMQAKAEVNVGYWAGLVPSNAADAPTLLALVELGAVGFKGFMCPSGINDFEHVTGPDIAAALPVLKRAGVPLMLHAEVVSEVPEPTVSVSDDVNSSL